MKKGDWILIGGLCLLAAVSLLLLRVLFSEPGSEAVVTIDGVVYAQLPLAQDATLTLPTEVGGSVIVVRNGAVFVESAACPDQICVSHRPITGQGEAIVCLPYRVLIEVVGAAAEEGAPDLIAY